MRLLITYLFSLFLLTSCSNAQNKEEPTAVIVDPSSEPVAAIQGMPISKDRYHGIVTINNGPRGGDYISTSGKIIPYRLFRIQFYNDTVVPVELNLHFPAEEMAMLSDTLKKVKAFLLPENITPQKVTDTNNFGIKGLEGFLDSGLNKPSILTKRIEPKQEYIVYIGATISLRARAKLFFNGQDPQVSYLPVRSLKLNSDNTSKLPLVFGIGIDPPNYYTLIHCGNVTFLKN